MKNICLVVALVVSLVTGMTILPGSGMANPAKSGVESVEQTAAKININTADAVQLSSVPGIGPKTADAIMAYRNDNGKFKSVDDLLNIKGIGSKKLEKMRPFVEAI